MLVGVSHLILTAHLDCDDVVEFHIKKPTLEAYNNLLLKNDYEAKKTFVFDNIVKPDISNLERIIDQYPGIVESTCNEILKLFKMHFRKLNKSVEGKWKNLEKDLGQSAMLLLDIIDKPKNENNYAMALLLMDGLACLRHLRLAYSKQN